MDRTCVSTAALRKPAVPRRLNAPTPTLATVAEATPPRTGVLRARYSGPQASRDGSSSLLESGQRRRLRWGRVESAPLMAGAVALASTGYIAAIDEKPGGATSARRASRVPTA